MASRNQNPLLELPPIDPGETLDDIFPVLQERFRTLQEIIERLTGPAEGDLDMNGHRIIRLGDPRDLLDAVNLAYLTRNFQRRAGANGAGGGGGTGGGTATVANRVLVLGRSDTLAIQSAVARPFVFASDQAFSEILGVVGQAPTGGNIVAQIQTVLGTVTTNFATLTIADGQTQAQIDGTQLGSIAGGSRVVLNLTSVGLTFPGADLSVMMRFG